MSSSNQTGADPSGVGPASGVPAWRVSILRPDRQVAGEGVLVDSRHVLTIGHVLTEALLGAKPTPRAELLLRFGTHPPVAVQVQLAETLTPRSTWVLSLPADAGHEPARVGHARRGDVVWAAGSRTDPGDWAEAEVGLEGADGTVELVMARGPVPSDPLGSVVDDAGRLVGLIPFSGLPRMIPAESAVGPVVGAARPAEGPTTPPVAPQQRAAPASRVAAEQPKGGPDSAENPDAPADSTDAADQPAGWHVVPRLAADTATVDDRLSRRRYVDALVAFLRHADTSPPLTIGVHGAWGTGKTSLMRMVRDELDPGAGTDEALPLRLTDGRGSTVTNAEVVRAVRRPPEPAAPAATVVGGDDIAESDWRPTVWFNPWLYQNGDQVWAGLAYAIISQVTERLPRGDRERFWLRLNMSRVDRESVRRNWHRVVVGRVLPMLLWWLVGLAAVAALLVGTTWLKPVWSPLVHDAAGWLGIGGVGTAALGGAARWWWSRTRPAAESFGTLLAQPSLVPGGRPGPDTPTPEPGYAGRLGFLHLVQTDMRRVLDMVATPERPLVVFVDDLDRCSPGTVAQVIEAINLFLAGEFRNCVFLLAMEPAAVVAHVEAAYPDLRAATADDPHGLGWRFLAKIVQLSLRLPEPDPATDLTAYVDHLLGEEPPPRPLPPDRQVTTGETVDVSKPTVLGSVVLPTRIPTVTTVPGARVARQEYRQQVAEIAAAIRRGRPTDAETLRAASLGAQRLVLGRGEPLAPETLAAAEQVFAERYSDRDAKAAILAALPSLGTGNPRELKRYVNLFRFTTFLAERVRLRGAPAPDGPAVAKLAAFAIRWPHLATVPGRLPALEAAADGDDEAWRAALAAAYPGLAEPTGAALRGFLRTAPTIGPAGFHLL
ncbi:MAG TPA: P-loop NTPase fold protein [Actinocatenispora sp.]